MTLTKACSILCIVLSALTAKAVPADTLVAIFDRQNFVQGDSIEIEIYTEPYRNNRTAQTLHLWIDNVKTGQRWKYRYPFLKGRFKFVLKINDSMPNGKYAFIFLLQNQFLAIKGKFLHATKRDSSLNFVAQGKNKIPIIDGAVVRDGYFNIDHLFYTDTVLFSFSPVKKTKENPLQMTIATPIDSAFEPEAVTTEFIYIGDTELRADAETVKTPYSFDIKDRKDSKLLKEVTLQTKVKKPVDEYIDKYVSGLFGNEDARILDFFENEEALSYSDLFSYLTFKFPELIQRTSSLNGQSYLTYRNEAVDIYLDEFYQDKVTDNVNSVSIQDIALVKFFRQSFRLGGGLNDDGFGGSIAIYTKRPQDRKGNKLSNYTFLIKGYTAKKSEWK